MRKSKFMKALLVFGMSAITATSIVGFAACDSGNGEGSGSGDGGDNGGNGHTHVYDTNWSTTPTEHWHEPICGDTTEVADKGTHKDDDHDNYCDVCHYELAHTFATEWSYDANGHWHAATCDHTTERDGEATHTDEDADGTCDESCGYTYTIPEVFTNLRTKQGVNVLLANTFITSAKVPAYNSENLGKTPSITSSVSETNYTEIKDGAAKLVDTSGSETTYMYVDFGGAEGVTEGYFEFTPDATPKITPVQFFGGEGTSEIFGLRMDGTLKYRLDGGTATAGAQEVSLVPNEAIKVYFSFNSVDNTLTVKINNVGSEDAAFYTGILSGGIKGIKFSSQGSGTASISVDNLVIVNTPLSLDDSKSSANNKITAEKAKIHSDVTVTDTEIKATFDAALEAAQTSADVNNAYNTYYTALVGLYSKAAGDTLIAQYPKNSYTKDENKAAYEAAADAFKYSTADTISEITEAYTTAVDVISKIKPDSYYDQATFAVTVSDGTNSATIEGLRSGDKVTKADLDAKLTLTSTQVCTGYTIEGTAVDFGTDGYAVTGAVTFTAVIVEATSDKGTYTFTLASKTDTAPTIVAGAGSLSDGTGILTSNMVTATDFAGWKFGSGDDTLTLTLKVTAGQTITLTVSGYTGSSGNEVALLVDATGPATLQSGDNEKITYTSASSKSSVESGTVHYTASSAGTVTITIKRTKNSAGSAKTTKVTEIVVAVADPA